MISDKTEKRLICENEERDESASGSPPRERERHRDKDRDRRRWDPSPPRSVKVRTVQDKISSLTDLLDILTDFNVEHLS